MTDQPATDEMAREMRAAWFRYLDTIEQVRPALHRYCRRITGNVWDAEDLLQDTLLRGFGAIGRGDLHGDESRVKNPRAYLFRTATNLWIGWIRRNQREADEKSSVADIAKDAPDRSIGIREAGSALFAGAAPQERAAVILKDVFDFSLEEAAELLSTTVGAVKSALHRGRAHLEESPSRTRLPSSMPSKGLVDRFVAAFNAKDVPGLTALLLEGVSIEALGVGGGRTRGGGWLKSSLRGDGWVDCRIYSDEPIVIHMRSAQSRTFIEGVTRFEEADGQISKIRDYWFCPETLTEIASELRLTVENHGYRQAAQALSDMVASTKLPWITKCA